MPNTSNLGRFSYTAPAGVAAPRGEYKVTVNGVVTQVAHVDRVREKKNGTHFVEGTYWPVSMFGGWVSALPEATFLH